MKRALAIGMTALIASLFGVAELRAQAFTPLSWTSVPASAVADPAGASEADLGVAVSHLSVGAAYPVSFGGGRTRLIGGVRYQRLGLGYRDGRLAAPRPDALHYLRYDLTLVLRFSDRWTATAYVAPGLASDFGGRLSADDLHLRTAVLVACQAGPRLTYGLGATYRDRLDNAWLPVVQLAAPLGPRLRVDVVAPSYAQLWMAPRADRDFELGLEVRFSTTPFHLGDAPSDGATRRMQYKLVTGGALARVRLVGPAYLSLEGGLTLLHQLGFEGAAGRTVDLEGGPYVRGAVVLQTGF